MKLLGIFHWKVHQGLGCTPGIPDLIGIYEGKLLGIEIKTPKGKLNPNQESFLKRINEEGGTAFVARSPDDVIEALDIKNLFRY